MKKRAVIINGPNLNMLGKREPEIYGTMTLKEIEQFTKKSCEHLAITQTWFQSNHEGKIIDYIHALKANKAKKLDYLVINPGALSHTSIALLDALKMLTIPIAEVHLTNTFQRESYRHTLLTAQSATIIMKGLGFYAYAFALHGLAIARP